MNIFSVPEEVIDGSVLPYLEWNDLLRFRRVCKWTKAITDGYLKLHPELVPELEIDEGEKSFGAFLEMGIPTSKIFLKNLSGDDFFHEAGEDATDFLEQFGTHVKSLRMDQVSILIYGKEWDFLIGLKNLESIEAGRYGGYPRGLDVLQAKEALQIKQLRSLKDPRSQDEDGKTFVFPPSVLKQLKKLKIGNNEHRMGHIFGLTQAVLKLGESLEHFGLPFDPYTNPDIDNAFDGDTAMQIYFVTFLFHISKRLQAESTAPRFKVIDFFNYHDALEEDQVEVEIAASQYFIQLCSQSAKQDVKLMNVASGWFFAMKTALQLDYTYLGTPVVSLINIHPSMLPLSMPNLEKVEIRRTLRSSPGVNWRTERVEWPSLKVLDITVDSKECRYSEWNRESQLPVFNRTNTKQLFDFFFQDVSRTSLTELHLHFTKEGLPVPKTEHVVSSCPNLKKLTLNNWLGTNKALTRLWSGLQNLEDVSLKDCKGLGNVAFVGVDVKSPVFRNLKNLKKLTLEGLDKMPKITDSLFSLVIRHMKLSHLILNSDAPIKSVTLAGVRSLCDEIFAESIEKFPFREWSLSNVSTAEFQEHEKMFRAYYMR